MATGQAAARGAVAVKSFGIFAAAIACLLVGGCAGMGSALDLAASDEPSMKLAAKGPQTDLEKATDYWAKAFEKNPRDPQNAVNYAKNLKALGQKQQALGVLQAGHGFTANNRTLNSEYGRLALELDQVSTAQKLLEQADDPANPDWRTISARGTVLAKQGNFTEAVPHFERALAVAPNQPTVLNNLAMAHAMNGHPDRAEVLLRQAAELNSGDARINQNLALVLGLQGKHDEAKVAGGKTLAPDLADTNVAYVREMVKTDVASAASSRRATPAVANVATGSLAKIKPMEAKAEATPAIAAAALADTYANANPMPTAAAAPGNAAAALADAHYAAEQARLAKAKP